MASTKSGTKAAPAKQLVPATRKAAKPEPVAKAAARKPLPKAAPKTAPKPATKPAAKTAEAKPQSKKPAGVPPEQRRNYIEMAAYYIAERRGFAPGNPLEDWVQAEAEIDRLLAEGRLGK